MPPNYSAGDHTYGEPTIIFSGQGVVCRVGKYCSIAGDVTIFLGGEHRIDTVASYPFYEREGIGAPNAYSKGNVVIGSDVWIGEGVTILSGVTIGDGAVIGACALVAKDVPPYAVMVGNQARIARYRFSKQHIAELLKLKWWDWERDEIEAHAAYLSGADIYAFLKACQ